jgi:hypothetical protein
MKHLVTVCLLWFNAIGCGLLAGLYFAFSTFIMTALGRIEPVHGVSAIGARRLVSISGDEACYKANECSRSNLAMGHCQIDRAGRSLVFY